MAATLTNKEKNKLPDWAVSTANQIEELGFFTWTFDWERDVPSPKEINRVQIRDEGHVGQAGEVSKYAEAMKRGDKFPPAVFSSDGRLIDGNTRELACRKLNHTTFPAFTIQEGYEGADKFTAQRFHILGAAFNTGGPKPLTRTELSEQVKMAAENEDDWDTNRLSGLLHVKRNVVQSIFAEHRATQRAERLGIALNGGVNPSARALLGGRSDKFADDVFREIARLAQDAGMTNNDLGELCKRVTDTTTGDGDRLSLIASERAAREQQIMGFRASGKRKPPLAARVRSASEFLVLHKDQVSELLDTNPNTRDEYTRLIDEAQVVLARLVSEQRLANEKESVS